MKYIALTLLLFVTGCASNQYSKSKFFCLAPMNYEVIDGADPSVTVHGLNIVITKDEGKFIVPRSLCVEARAK